MSVKKRFDGTQYRTVECSLRMLDEEKRTVELSFSSETPLKRWGAYEVLSHKKNAVSLERINTTGSLLFNHNRDKVVGKIVKAKIEDKRGVATVQFDDDEESTVIFNKVKNGSLRGVSVGYIVLEYEKTVTGEGESRQVTYTATSWEPLEISVVSVPADITVGVGRSIEDEVAAESRSMKMLDNQIKINQNLTYI